MGSLERLGARTGDRIPALKGRQREGRIQGGGGGEPQERDIIEEASPLPS